MTSIALSGRQIIPLFKIGFPRHFGLKILQLLYSLFLWGFSIHHKFSKTILMGTTPSSPVLPILGCSWRREHKGQTADFPAGTHRDLTFPLVSSPHSCIFRLDKLIFMELCIPRAGSPQELALCHPRAVWLQLGSRFWLPEPPLCSAVEATLPCPF